MNVDEIDVSNIVSGDVITNDRQGMFTKPKYQYTTKDGEDKLSLSEYASSWCKGFFPSIGR